jgi:hypothetical protein
VVRLHDVEFGNSGEHALAADDFLPTFTFILVRAGLPQVLLTKTLLVALCDPEESIGEIGYYLASMEAGIQHVQDLFAGDVTMNIESM